MLRMVGSNSGDFVCTQVLHNLWKLYLCKQQMQVANGRQPRKTNNDNKNTDYNNNYYNSAPNSKKTTFQFETEKNRVARPPPTQKICQHTSDDNSTNSQPMTRPIIRNVKSKSGIKPTKKKMVFLKLFKSSAKSSSNPTISKAVPTAKVTKLSIAKTSETKNEFEKNRFQSIKRVPIAKRVNEAMSM